PRKEATIPPLRRGKACLNCRYLKIKCDGVRPVCGSCVRVPKDDQCEYTDAMSRTQRLENTVCRLKMRLSELKTGACFTNYAGLSSITDRSAVSSNPSARGSPLSGCSSSYDGSPLLPQLILDLQSSPSSEYSILASQIELGRRSEEPPSAMIHMLLESFLPHATQFGFLLHPQRFRDAVLLPFPCGDERRPSPALLYVAYLWGVHLSQSASLHSFAAAFHERALQHLATEISTRTHSTHWLHTIQAQVLLSTYFFRTRRVLEAEVYANGAATLALGYQLHKIHSSRPETPRPSMIDVFPAPLADVVDEGQRVRAFWAVACLQSNLSISSNTSRGTRCILESPGGQIDTPWPLEIEDYEMVTLPAQRMQDTIRHFLMEDPFLPSPICTLHAKASALLYRATRINTKWSSDPSLQELDAFTTAYTWLDQRITAFWESLPPICVYYDNSADARILAVTHALTAASAIHLHRSPGSTDPQAPAKCLFAARAILDCLGDARVGAQAIVHPVVGALCVLACQVLMEEITSVCVFRATWAAGVGADDAAWAVNAGAEEAALIAELRRGMATMGVYAAGCPLIEYQLHMLRQQYESL
ncbi:hypothetical protein B0H13DRAFT_2562227, partial [Mycena leptocephala]